MMRFTESKSEQATGKRIQDLISEDHKCDKPPILLIPIWIPRDRAWPITRKQTWLCWFGLCRASTSGSDSMVWTKGFFERPEWN